MLKKCVKFTSKSVKTYTFAVPLMSEDQAKALAVVFVHASLLFTSLF
jgi:hypothetical protein